MKRGFAPLHNAFPLSFDEGEGDKGGEVSKQLQNVRDFHPHLASPFEGEGLGRFAPFEGEESKWLLPSRERDYRRFPSPGGRG